MSHEVTEQHKWFAKEFLLRKNPYRGNLSLVEDPAIAMIEISNENSIFMWGSESILSALPEYYASEFHANFSKWLRTKYASTEALREAWAPKNINECAASLTSRKCSPKSGAADLITKKLPEWYFGKMSGDGSITENSDGSVTVKFTATSQISWHLQLVHRGIKLDKDKTYIIQFSARSLGGSRPLGFSVTMDESPWGQVA